LIHGWLIKYDKAVVNAGINSCLDGSADRCTDAHDQAASWNWTTAANARVGKTLCGFH
jgi:hypothetical protein